MSTSPDSVTKREKRLAAREDRKKRAAAAQKVAKVRQFVLIGIATVVLIGFVVAAAMTSFFGLAVTPIGRALPIEGNDHVPDTQAVTYKSRPPTSGPHSASVYPRYGMIDPAPPTGQWLHNLEHGAVAFLYNCPQGCPEIVQKLTDLYPTLQLGRNARRGSPRALIFPYQDMDHQIAAVAWGWLLELDSFDQDKLVKFFDSRIDRGPECQALACPEM
ncbi:MAG: DUF3105 domain-containing protein [Chloroflexota bacterium]